MLGSTVTLTSAELLTIAKEAVCIKTHRTQGWHNLEPRQQRDFQDATEVVLRAMVRLGYRFVPPEPTIVR